MVSEKELEAIGLGVIEHLGLGLVCGKVLIAGGYQSPVQLGVTVLAIINHEVERQEIGTKEPTRDHLTHERQKEFHADWQTTYIQSFEKGLTVGRAKLSLKRGDIVTSPFEDGVDIRILANTGVGISFKHPEKGYCGLRYDSMTDVEYQRLGG